MKSRVISIVHLVTIVISIGDALGQQYETRQGGPAEDITGEGYSLSSKRRDVDISKSRRIYDSEFDAVRGAFQDTGEMLRDQQSATGSGGRVNTVGRTKQHDCDNNDIAECVGLLEVLTNKDLGFAASVDELNNMCPVLLNGLQCIDSYTRRCLSLKHREYFNKLYAGTIRVIKDLCNTKGKYQLEYIRHAPCMRQVNPKYNECSEAYHKKTADLNQINDAVVQLSDEEKNKNVITLCCSFQEYLQCSEQVVFETCGNETALFTKEFLDRMAGPIVQDLCQAFYFSLHSCSQESSTSTQKTVVDSEEDVFHDPSTLPSASDSVDPHSVQPVLPHSDSSLVFPNSETFVDSTNKLHTVPSDGTSDHGNVDLVSEVRLRSHATSVSVEVEVISKESEEATDSTVESPSITNKITRTRLHRDQRKTLHDLENEVSYARFGTENPAVNPQTSVRDIKEHEHMNKKIHAVTSSSHAYENFQMTSTEIGHTDSPLLTVSLSSVASPSFITEESNFDNLRDTWKSLHRISPKLLQDDSVRHIKKKRDTNGEYSSEDSAENMDPESMPLGHSSVSFHKRRIRPGSIKNTNYTQVGNKNRRRRPYRRRSDRGTFDTVEKARPLKRRLRPNLRRPGDIARNISVDYALSDSQQFSKRKKLTSYQRNILTNQEEGEQEKNANFHISKTGHNKTEIGSPPIASHVNITATEQRRNSTIHNPRRYGTAGQRHPWGFQRRSRERRKRLRGEGLVGRGSIPPRRGRIRPRRPRIHGRPIVRKHDKQGRPFFAMDKNIPVLPGFVGNKTASNRNITSGEDLRTIMPPVEFSNKEKINVKEDSELDINTPPPSSRFQPTAFPLDKETDSVLTVKPTNSNPLLATPYDEGRKTLENEISTDSTLVSDKVLTPKVLNVTMHGTELILHEESIDINESLPNYVSESVHEETGSFGVEQNGTTLEMGNCSMSLEECGGMSSSEDSSFKTNGFPDFMPFGLNESIYDDHDLAAFENENTLPVDERTPEEFLESMGNISESNLESFFPFGSIVETDARSHGNKDEFPVTTSPVETFYWWFQSRVLNEVQEAVIPVPTPAPFTVRLLQEMTNKEIPAANFAAVTLDILDSDFVPLLKPQVKKFEGFPKNKTFVTLEEALSLGKHHINATSIKGTESLLTSNNSETTAHDGKLNTSVKEIILGSMHPNKDFLSKNYVNITNTHSPEITEHTKDLNKKDLTASENGINSTAFTVNITDQKKSSVNPENNNISDFKSLSDINESKSEVSLFSTNTEESLQSKESSHDNLTLSTSPLEGSGDEMLETNLQNLTQMENYFGEYAEILQSQNCSERLSCKVLIMFVLFIITYL